MIKLISKNSIKNIVNEQEKLTSDLINKYENAIREKDNLIKEQNDIIEKQKEYIYNLLSEIEQESRTPFFNLKLGFSKILSFLI